MEVSFHAPTKASFPPWAKQRKGIANNMKNLMQIRHIFIIVSFLQEVNCAETRKECVGIHKNGLKEKIGIYLRPLHWIVLENRFNKAAIFKNHLEGNI
jgi:hypothetical protein